MFSVVHLTHMRLHVLLIDCTIVVLITRQNERKKFLPF